MYWCEGNLGRWPSNRLKQAKKAKNSMSKAKIRVINPLGNKLSPIPIFTSVGMVLSDPGKWVLDANYQRGYVWKRNMAIDLIDSLVSGRMINAIHVIDLGNGKYEVMDGKQRLTTILNFVNPPEVGNPLAVPIQCTDGVIREKTYRQIKEAASKGDAVCVNFVDRFNNAGIQIQNYSGLTHQEKIQLFELLNNYVPMSKNEKIFGRNYYARGFLSKMFRLYFFKPLGENVSVSVRTSSRDEQNRFVATFLIHSFSVSLGEYEGAFSADTEDVSKFAGLLNGKIGGFLFDGPMPKNSEEIDGYVQKFLDKKQYDQMKKSIECFACVFDPVNMPANTTDKADQGWAMDCLLWFRRGLNNKTLTVPYVHAEWKKFQTLLLDYRTWRRENAIAMKGKAHQGLNQNLRLDQITKAFLDPTNEFDTGPKNQQPTTGERKGVFLNMPKTDPVSGRKLHGGNVQVDHVPPASICSQCELGAIEATTNRRKGNLDAKAAVKVVVYQKKNEKKAKSSKK